MVNLPFNVSGAATLALVPAVGGQRVAMYRLYGKTGAAMTLQLRDGPVTPLTGVMQFTNGQDMNLFSTNEPLFVTSIGNGLFVTKTSASAFAGVVWFVQG